LIGGNKRGRMEMAKIKNKETVVTKEQRKKTTCPEGLLKSEAEKNTELVLKLLRGYYQMY
jgi:hypothetical protein